MLIKDKISLWRELFYGRQEAFGHKVTTYSNTGEVSLVYQPAFKNKKSENPDEKFTSLGDEHIESHIKGSKELLIYLLHADNSVRFAAMDFDTGHSFADVLKAQEIIKKNGFPCYIARSTKKGYHLYMFFDRQIPAYIVTSYIKNVYDLIGWMTELNEENRCLPETFPKTTQLRDPGATGYGIKPPMHGEGLLRDRNCWVDDNDVPIGGKGSSEEQWDYMQKMERISVSSFKSFLGDNQIPMDNIRISESRGAVEQTDYKRTVPYAPPEDGDLLRVLEGCPAAKRLWFNTPRSEVPHHFHVAVLSWAMRTKNGLDIIRDYWKDSPNKHICEAQIDYALRTVQQPWTCRAMQDHHFCLKGVDPRLASGELHKNGELLNDYCFNKIPPKEIVHGQLVINPDELPQSEWKDPSPIRMRTRMKKVDPKWVRGAIDGLTSEDPDLPEKITEVYQYILLVKDKRERSELIDYLKSKKLMKVKELKEFEKEALEITAQEARQELEAQEDVVTLNDVVYQKTDIGYAVVTLDKQGDPVQKQFTNFHIELEKNLEVHSIMNGIILEFRGHLICKGVKHEFRISAEDWSSNQRLAARIAVCSRAMAVVDSKSFDKLRGAVSVFGMQNMIHQTSYENYGYDDEIAPSVFRSTKWNITAEGYVGNTDSSVDLKTGGYASYLGLEKLNKEDFSKVVFSVKNNLLPFQDSILTYTTVAHTLQAAIHNVYIPMKEAPILWIQGLTGSGKSTLAHFAQNFHGNFPRLLNVSSTPKSIEFYTMLFKDALLVLDDFKEAFYREGVIKLIQTLYDKSSRGRLKKDLSQAAAPHCRGLVMVTSEDQPTSEASAMSRCLFLEAPHIVSDDPDSDRRFKALRGVQDRFSGITGRFVHWMLQTHSTGDSVREKFFEYAALLKEPVARRQNSNRIASNVAANFLTWELFLDFLLDNQLATSGEVNEMRAKHWGNCQTMLKGIVRFCSYEQASNLFVSVLRDLLASGAYKLGNYSGNANDRADIIGYVDPMDPGQVYILPSVAIGAVKKAVKERGSCFSHSMQSVGNQLVQDKLVSQVGKDGKALVRKQFDRNRGYFWCLDGAQCEIGPSIEESNNHVAHSDPDEDVLASF